MKIKINKGKQNFKDIEKGDLFIAGKNSELYLKTEDIIKVIYRERIERKGWLGIDVEQIRTEVHINAISIRTGEPVEFADVARVTAVEKIEVIA